MPQIAKTALVQCLVAATLAVAGAANAQSVTTVTSVSPDKSTIIYGNFVTISAFVSSSQPVLSGTVAFCDDGALIPGAGGVPLINGLAFVKTDLLFVGSDLITASYSGSTGLSPSSGSFFENVLKASTALDLSASANSVSPHGQLLLTADVTPVGTPAKPFGNVSFFDGSTLLGTEPLNGAGVATFRLFADGLPLGPQALSARYGGDINFNSSAGRQSVTVSVPEPASWSLMIAGFGLAGFMLRRRQVPGRRPRAGRRFALVVGD